MKGCEKTVTDDSLATAMYFEHEDRAIALAGEVEYSKDPKDTR
jgi:hypothetical protein